MGLYRFRVPVMVVATAALAFALGGCSRNAEQPGDQAPTEQPVEHEPAPANVVGAEKPPVPAETMTRAHNIEAPPAPPVSREAQMMDDAAASGMTARLPRSNDNASDTGDSAQDDAR